MEHKAKATYRNVSKGCSNHEIEEPGMDLQDVCWGHEDPRGAEQEEQHWGYQWQHDFIHRVVLQGVIFIGPERQAKT